VVSYGDAEPWCPQCEWNLDLYKPWFEREGFEGSLNRRAHAVGFRQGPQIVRELAGHEVPRPTPTWHSRVLVGVSVVLYALIAALWTGGAWLVSRLRPVEFLAGAVMLGLGWALRPRLGSRRKALKVTWELNREQTPALFALLDRIAADVGGRTPDTVAFGVHWMLSIASVGLRRRQVLVIGLPLFVTATPQERIALLAHELAHQVNGDARRSLLTQPALTALGRIAVLTHWRTDLDIPFLTYVALLLRLIAYPAYAAHLGLSLLGSRESRRAEHYADALAARVAGTQAAQSMLDLFVLGHDMEKLIDGIAMRRGSQGGWRSSVQAARRRWSEDLEVRRQLTLRLEASAFASHPATGLRRQLLGVTPFHHPALALTEAEVERLDRETGGYVLAYDRFLNTLAGPSAE
jgi:Zn-dependent protease with chaperone function